MCTRAPWCARRREWGEESRCVVAVSKRGWRPRYPRLVFIYELVWKQFYIEVSMAFRGWDPAVPCYIYLAMSVGEF